MDASDMRELERVLNEHAQAMARIAIVNARVAVSQGSVAAMTAENAQREHLGQSMAYDDATIGGAFNGLGVNDLVAYLAIPNV